MQQTSENIAQKETKGLEDQEEICKSEEQVHERRKWLFSFLEFFFF